jgi:Trypsin-like peptidase domain
MSEIDHDSVTASESWLAGGPPRPMTAQEAELRAEWTETFQQMTLRVGAMACTAITVRLPSGDEAIGTAFHVGEGVYLTARHVLEGNTILALIPDTSGWLFRDELTVEAPTGGRLNGEISMWRIHHPSPHIARGPFFHKDPAIDVAAFVAGGIDPNTPAMALGFHYDDWIEDRQWLLTKATVFGYPPVPTASGPIQLAATVEVNGVVDTYRDHYVRFVVSGPPRGGFSGGPAFHEHGFVLGMVIESLEDLAKSDPGFFTVLSIEALHEILEQHGLTPAQQMPPTPEESIAMAREELAAREAAREARRAGTGKADEH